MQRRKLVGAVLKFEKLQRRNGPKEFRAHWSDLKIPVKQVVANFDVNPTTVSRWRNQLKYERAVEKLAAFDAEYRAEVPAEIPDSHWELREEHLEVMVDDFLRFRTEFFRTPRGESYETPKFQQEWLRALLNSLITGGRQIVLSPPRHGKTELLIHIATWLICLFPNIRILWVGGNERIAQRSVNAVARILASNEDLIETYSPVLKFKPGTKDGFGWSKSEFTVAAHDPGIKGTTMTALGRGGNLRSLDADVVVVDDIEDHGSTAQAGSREGTREWWTIELESRKEEHTGLFLIGSRQHPDDLSGHLLENEEYESIVERAHDPACTLPADDPDVHQDCMLFPSLRSYRYLMKQKLAAETTGGQGLFDMVYQNMPVAAGFQVFTPDIVDPCRSATHTVGAIPNVEGIRLVAGLDPAGSGYQAAFLWAFTVQPELRMWMVDLENQEGGGIAKARETIRAWTEKYPVRHWVIEENLFQGGIVTDNELRAYSTVHGIRLQDFKTYLNKVDPRFGVTSLQPLFASKQIVLPYANTESQVKTDTYRAQLIYWDGTARRNTNTKAGYKSDLVMASWFPMTVIRHAMQEVIAEMGVDYQPSYGWYQPHDWNMAPWERRSA